jgi:hypothetical protein
VGRPILRRRGIHQLDVDHVQVPDSGSRRSSGSDRRPSQPMTPLFQRPSHGENGTTRSVRGHWNFHRSPCSARLSGSDNATRSRTRDFVDPPLDSLPGPSNQAASCPRRSSRRFHHVGANPQQFELIRSVISIVDRQFSLVEPLLHRRRVTDHRREISKDTVLRQCDNSKWILAAAPRWENSRIGEPRSLGNFRRVNRHVRTHPINAGKHGILHRQAQR